MNSTRRYVSCADTAKLLRKALKAKFPKIKFSVRSETYSGGASIDVSWTDGPRACDVERVTSHYNGATFDGMIDLKSYHDTMLSNPDGSVERVHFGADFIFTNRKMSDTVRAGLINEFEAIAGEIYDDNKNSNWAVGRDGKISRWNGNGVAAHWGSSLIGQMFSARTY